MDQQVLLSPDSRTGTSSKEIKANLCCTEDGQSQEERLGDTEGYLARFWRNLSEPTAEQKPWSVAAIAQSSLPRLPAFLLFKLRR